MNLLIFGMDGRLRRVGSELFAGAVHNVSATEAYFATRGTAVLEIRHPLFGFNPFGLLRPKRDLIVTVVDGDGLPLHLDRDREHQYRAATLTEEQQGDLLDIVDTLAGQLADHKAERQETSTRREWAYMAVVLGLLGILIGELFFYVGPSAASRLGDFFGH